MYLAESQRLGPPVPVDMLAPSAAQVPFDPIQRHKTVGPVPDNIQITVQFEQGGFRKMGTESGIGSVTCAKKFVKIQRYEPVNRIANHRKSKGTVVQNLLWNPPCPGKTIIVLMDIDAVGVLLVVVNHIQEVFQERTAAFGDLLIINRIGFCRPDLHSHGFCTGWQMGKGNRGQAGNAHTGVRFPDRYPTRNPGLCRSCFQQCPA